MDTKKELKPIRVNDVEAIKLVRENAPKQRRSLSGCAAIAIIKVLSGAGKNVNSDVGAKQEKKDKS